MSNFRLRKIALILTSVDGVFHIAGWNKIGVKDKQAEQINVEGIRHVLEMMQELAIPKGVYTSTVGVFSDTSGQLVDGEVAEDAAEQEEHG